MRKLVMILLGVIFPVCVWAQDPVQFGIGFQTSVLGYDQDEIDTSKMFWGGHGRVRAMKYLGGEVSLLKREDNFAVNDGNIELDTVPLQVSGVVYPLGMFPVTPYFVVGGGWYFLTATVTGDIGVDFVTGIGTVKHTEAAFHIGVGGEAFLGEHFSMGGDVRKIFLDFETSIINYSVDAYFVNFGATFYF